VPVARVVALFDDLLLGSNVLGMLRAAGHEARLTGDRAKVQPGGADLLICDCTSEPLDAAGLVAELRAAGELDDVKLLGVYSHVRPEQRERALRAGFDQVVPRSRMAREGPALVQRLLER
jgi:CheY-like chemotaxis protein